MKTTLLFGFLALVSSSLAFARGGEGFRGGMEGEGFREGAMEGERFREEAPRLDENYDAAVRDDVDLNRDDDANLRINDADGSADVRVRPEGDDTANVDVRTADGKNYDANIAGPDGYRNGYIWQNGDYVAVNLDPFVPYLAPYGAWSGWSIVTQPDYVQYPVYATYPVETAVEVALQNLGLYTGPIDGDATSCAGAIEQYQMQNSLPVTGVISPELLTALGIQASFE
jgi:hypothetical protein